jgi:predicted nucleotidyltransferase
VELSIAEDDDITPARVLHKRALPSRTLREIVSQVVEVAQPERIILFGSAAHGEMRPNSDVDLLVVNTTEHRRLLAKQIYRHLIGVGQAVDEIVVTPADLERYRDSDVSITARASREGKVVYPA